MLQVNELCLKEASLYSLEAKMKHLCDIDVK